MKVLLRGKRYFCFVLLLYFFGSISNEFVTGAVALCYSLPIRWLEKNNKILSQTWHGVRI